MKFGRAIAWEDVLETWRKTPGANIPNPDVWQAIPSGSVWFECEIEASDVEQMHVIGSDDWTEIFGSFTLLDIARHPRRTSDPYRHIDKIEGITNAYSAGSKLQPPILTADSGHGPFVIIEGNHRCIALLRLDKLVGSRVFVGCHPRMASDFIWFRSVALQAKRNARHAKKTGA